MPKYYQRKIKKQQREEKQKQENKSKIKVQNGENEVKNPFSKTYSKGSYETPENGAQYGSQVTNKNILVEGTPKLRLNF